MRPWEWFFLGGLALVYVPAFMDLAGVWRSVDYYSHGFLVPFVAIWAANRVAPQLASASCTRDCTDLSCICFSRVTTSTPRPISGGMLSGTSASSMMTTAPC